MKYPKTYFFFHFSSSFSALELCFWTMVFSLSIRRSFNLFRSHKLRPFQSIILEGLTLFDNSEQSCCVAIFWLSEITLFNRFTSALRFLTSAGSAPPVRFPRITAAETAAAARFGFRRASPCSLSFYTSSKVLKTTLGPDWKKSRSQNRYRADCNILAW